ncbi:hypothetical protein, partial [Acinetobacter baumannii]|uniref:hypothetical protein n=1 Tax=Acinetobacter baumannii TaxID=470 RepID=UPI00197A934A
MQTVTVEHNTAPSFDGGSVPADVTVECDSVPAAASPTASSVCGAVTVSFTETQTSGLCPYDYT